MSPRTLLSASIAAVLPVGLWAGLALDGGRGMAAVGGRPGGWEALLLAAGTGFALFLSFRRRTGREGPGLAAACAFACFPALPDALASPGTLPLFAGVAAAGVLLVLLGAPEGGGSRAPRFLAVAAVAALAAVGLPLLSPDPAAQALLPSGLLLAPGAAVLAGEAARRIQLRADLPEGKRRGLALLLALVIAAGAGVSLHRARSWESPRTFWERAVGESSDPTAALGALAEVRAEPRNGEADLPGARQALRRFVESVRSGGGAALSEEAIRRGAEGAVRAALALLTDPSREGEPADEVAVEALEAAHEWAPASPLVLRGMGERRLVEGRFQEAAALLEEAVSLDSSSAVTWDALARALIPATRIGEALEASQRATGLQPTVGAFSRTYAEALLAAGRSREALTILIESLGEPPFDPVQARAFSEAHRRVALTEISSGRVGRARRLLAAGLRVDPSSAACQELKKSLDHRYEAERAEHEALLLPGPDGSVLPDNLLLYAAWLCRWGEFEQAQPYFTLLLEERGGTAAVHFQVGQVFWEGRGTEEGYERAVLSYRDALSRDPAYVEARNRLWQALVVLGRLDEARVEARRFLERAPSHPDAVDAERFVGGGARTGDGDR